MPNHSKISNGFLSKYQFWIFTLAAIIFIQIPLVSLPFKWLESYFHEVSHGLAALLTGGSVVKIQLFPNGAGLCTTRGGFSLFISFMGYAGAIGWGYLIYSIASINQKIAKIASGAIIALICCSLIFWVRDLLTLFILLIVLSIFLLQFKLPRANYLQKLLKFTGMMVLLNSLLSPFYLLDGRSIGDGAALASMTFVPEFIWVIIWSSIAILALFTLNKQGK